MNNKPKKELILEESDLQPGVTAFSKRLALLIKETTGGDVGLFAERSKGQLKLPTIRNYLRGQSEPKMSSLVLISDIGNCSLEWLLTGHNENHNFELMEPKKVFTMDYAAALILGGVFDKNAILSTEEFISEDRNFRGGSTIFNEVTLNRNWLLELSSTIESIILVAAKDFVMAPTVNRNDVLIIDTSIRIPDGGMYFILYNNKPEFRRLLKLPNNKTRIINENPLYPIIDVDDDEFISVLGRVLYIFKGKMV
jgi:hypothetical protein